MEVYFENIFYINEITVGKINSFLFLTLIAGVLSGCATVYAPPKLGEQSVTINDMRHRIGFDTWTNTEIDAIDNKSLGFTLFGTSKLHVHPGRHVLTVRVTFNRGLFDTPSYGVTEVAADFKPNHTYTVKGDYQNSLVNAWVVDETGRKVSATSSTSYHKTVIETSHPVFIPVPNR